jgi:hypothetical protein
VQHISQSTLLVAERNVDASIARSAASMMRIYRVGKFGLR